MKKIFIITTLILFVFYSTIYSEDKIQQLLQNAQKFILKKDKENAIKAFQEILEIEPYNLDYINDLGSLYAEIRKFELAKEKFKQSITIAPSYIKAYNNLGLIYIAEGNVLQGIDVFEQGLKNDPTYANIYSNLALAYYNIKMYYKAVEVLELGAKNCPNDNDIAFKLAVLYEEIGWKNYALEKYRELLTKEPNNIKVLKNLSAFYIQQELYSNAVNNFNKIISISNNEAYDGSIYYYLGYCRKKQGAFDEAIKALKKHLKKFPKDLKCYYELYSLYRDAFMFKEANNQYKEIIDLEPNFDFSTQSLPIKKQVLEYKFFLKNDKENTDYKMNLAINYYKIGLMDESLKLANSIIKKDSENFFAIILKGLINIRRGKYSKDENIFINIVKNYSKEKLEEIYVKYPYTKEMLSEAQELQKVDKSLDKEREEIRNKIKKDSQNANLHYEYGKFFEKIGLNDFAILEYQDTVLYKNNFFEAYLSLINVYIKTGKADEGLTTANQMQSVFSNSDISYLILGKLNYLVYDLKSAEVNFKKCIEINVSNLEAREYLRSIYRNNGNLEKAMEEHKFITKINPSYNFVKQELNNEQKINEFCILIACNNANSASVYAELIEIYFKIGDIKEAGFLIEQALKIFPDNLNFILFKGKILYLKEKNVEAEKIFSEILKISPFIPEVHLFLRNIYRDKDEIEKAIAEHNEILRLNPNFNFPEYFNLRFKQAVGEYKILSAINPKNSHINFQLAKTYYNYGYINQADKYIKMSLNLDPENKNSIELAKLISEIKKQKELFTQKVLLGAKHILLLDLKKAQEVKEMLNKGENFDALAKKNSYDKKTANTGGDLGVFYKGEFLKEFENAVEKLKVGEISNIIKTKLGYHIILRTK